MVTVCDTMHVENIDPCINDADDHLSKLFHNLLPNDTIFLCVASGPQHRGCTDYDKQCMFGNDMYLTEDHVSFLLYLCDPASPPKIKYYLHKMTYSSVRKWCTLVRLSCYFLKHEQTACDI